VEKICKKVPFLVIRIDLRPIINNVLGNWKAVTKYVLVPSFQNEKNMQRLLITIGLGIALIGVLYPYLKQIGSGQLSGDIILRGENSTFALLSAYLFYSY